MGLSQVELDVLGAVMNDYEAVHTLRDCHLKGELSEEEIVAALITLARLGFVDVFFYDVSLLRFRPASVDEFPATKLWFLANEKGRAEEQSTDMEVP